MSPRAFVVFAALACAGPLAAQDVPRAPTLLRVAAWSDGTTQLSLDSAAIACRGHGAGPGRVRHRAAGSFLPVRVARRPAVNLLKGDERCDP